MSTNKWKRAAGLRHYLKKRRILDDRKMATGCILCGERRHPAALDFHHIDPSQKAVNAADAIGNLGLPKLLLEMDKCVVLCATCHRLVEAGVLKIPPPSRPEEVWTPPLTGTACWPTSRSAASTSSS